MLLAACGSPPIARAPEPREPVVVSPPVPPAPPASTAAQAAEKPPPLSHFFAALGKLEDGTATGDVRIVELGDSHTAADYETGTQRRQLQARFGDGGRGFVMLGRPWKAWSQESVLSGMSPEWRTLMTPLTSDRSVTGDFFGLAGAAEATRVPGARAWTTVLAPFAHVEIAYLAQAGGGSFDVVVDNKVVERVPTRSDDEHAAYFGFDVAPAAMHTIEARARGDGGVRLFGMALDRSEHGIVYDALGMNGARILMPLSWQEAHWAAQLAHRAPDLVILAYGTNDAVATDMTAATFEADFTTVLARVKRAVPKASCLVMGPPDRALKVGAAWKTAPKLLEIIASEKKVAEAANCAFFDRFETMGGEGSIARWAAAGNLAQQDRVHLTREGYATLGTAFVASLVSGYEASRTSSSSRPTARSDR